MAQEEPTTIEQLYLESTKALGHELSQEEKTQVLLDAVLGGRRVEPFATLTDSTHFFTSTIDSCFEAFIVEALKEKDR